MSYTPGPLPEPDDKELESIAERHGVRWGGNFWIIEDADLHPFMRSMLAHTAAEVARAVAAERERWQDINAMAERLEQTAAKLADENESLRAELKRTIADALMAMTVAKASERERCAMLCESLWEIGGTQTAKEFAKEIRADPQRLQGKGE